MRRYLAETLSAALVLALAGGCASNTSANVQGQQVARQQALSAHYTGCVPQENVISNTVVKPHGGGTSTTWNATCNGKIYSCGSYQVRNNTGVSCKEGTR